MPSTEQPDDLDDYLATAMLDPEFKAAHEDAEHRAEVVRKLILAWNATGLTAFQLAEKMMTSESMVLAVYEGSDPRLSVILKYARACGYQARVTFEKIKEEEHGTARA